MIFGIVLITTALMTSPAQARTPTFDCEAEDQILTLSDIDACSLKKKTPTSEFCNPHDLSDNGTVWRVGSNRWNEEWEAAYEAWLMSEADPDLFVRYNLPTDCADAAIAYRIIFSRIHHLPFRMQPEIYRKGEVLGHDSMRFAKHRTVRNWSPTNWKTSIRLDDRFRAYLIRTMGAFDSIDVPYNTYPIQIANDDRCGFHPRFGKGVVVNDDGHVLTVFGLDPQTLNPLVLRASTSPVKLRSLNDVADRGNFYSVLNPSSEDVDHNVSSEARLQKLIKNGHGFVRWSWDVQCEGKWGKVRDKRMPNYSLEQYSFPFKSLSAFVRDINHVVPDEKYFASQIASIEKLTRDRVKLVEEGEKIRLQAAEDTALMEQLVDTSSSLYNEYSTPHRDTKICNQLNDVLLMVNDPQSTVTAGQLYASLYQTEITQLEYSLNTTLRFSLFDLIPFCTNRKPEASAPSSTLAHRWLTESVASARQGDWTPGLTWTVNPESDSPILAEYRILPSEHLVGRNVGPLIEIELKGHLESGKLTPPSRTTSTLLSGKVVQTSIRDELTTVMDPETGLTLRTIKINAVWDPHGETLHFAADGKTVLVRETFHYNRFRSRIEYYPMTEVPHFEERMESTGPCRSTYQECRVKRTYAETGVKILEEVGYASGLQTERLTVYALDTGLPVKEDHYTSQGELKETLYYNSRGEHTSTLTPYGDEFAQQRFFKDGKAVEDVFFQKHEVTRRERLDEEGKPYLIFDVAAQTLTKIDSLNHWPAIQIKYSADRIDAEGDDLKLLSVNAHGETYPASLLNDAKTRALDHVTRTYLRPHPLRQSIEIGHCKVDYDAETKSFKMDDLTVKAANSKDTKELFDQLKTRLESGRCYLETSDGRTFRFTFDSAQLFPEMQKLKSIWQNFKSRVGFAID